MATKRSKDENEMFGFDYNLDFLFRELYHGTV